MKRILPLAILVGTMASAMLVPGCGKKPESAEKDAASAAAGATPPAPEAAPADVTVQPAEVLAQLPEGHPKMEGLTDKEVPPPAAAHTTPPRNEPKVVVPDSVKARWKAVTLEVSGPGIKKRKIRVNPGQDVPLKHEGLSLTIGAFLPSYMSDFSQVTSDGDELKNPALYVTVLRNGKTVEKGWLFRDYTEFNTLSNKTVTLQLVAAHE